MILNYIVIEYLPGVTSRLIICRRPLPKPILVKWCSTLLRAFCRVTPTLLLKKVKLLMFKTRKSHLHTVAIAYLLLPPRCWLVDSCKSAGEAAAACGTSIGSSFPWLDDGLRRSLRIQPTDAFKDKTCHVNTIVVTNNADNDVPIPSLVEPLRLPRFPPKRCLLLSFSLNLWADMASAWTTEPLRKRGPSSPPQLSASLKWRKWIIYLRFYFFLLTICALTLSFVVRFIYPLFFLLLRFFSEVVSSTT